MHAKHQKNSALIWELKSTVGNEQSAPFHSGPFLKIGLFCNIFLFSKISHLAIKTCS